MPKGDEDLTPLLGTVADAMETKVVSLRPEQSLQEAAFDLERAEVSGAPVVDGGRVVGMVSLSALFTAAGVEFEKAATSGPWHRYEHALAKSSRSVGDVMTTTVVVLAPDTPITEAAAIMRERGVNRIPIVDADGGLVGIVARDDIVAAVAGAGSSG